MSGKILIIDDEKDIQNILREVLTDEGYIVEVADNGLEGFSKTKRFGPDLVLLDIKMPVKDGFEFLASMNDKLKPVPVIVITGIATKDEIDRALKAGVKRCVKKPFSISEILGLIKEILDFEDK